MSNQTKRNVTLNLWTARIIPVVLTGVVGYATYVLVALLTVNYLLVKHHDKAAAFPILTIYLILFLLMASSFFRLLYITTFHPPYVPRGANALRGSPKEKTAKTKTVKAENGVGGAEYDGRNDLGEVERREIGRHTDPDSPGLELFYSKDVFVCELDGKPKWCSICDNWKPDRAHHCSTSGRCILRMDHFCPWVGGPIGENNIKFFIQFVSYTALLCLHLLVVMAIYVSKQNITEGESINRNFAALLGLSGFFFMFTAGMSLSSTNFALLNVTQVEHLGLATRVYDLAVFKPNQNTPPASGSYLREITYPLPTGMVKTHSGPVMETSEVLDQRLVTGNEAQTNAARKERLSERDLQATRSFAVLRTEHGENPWNLGSKLLNWETVMGTSPVDWFLPIKRSPCCNHEDQESFYFLGPTIDLIRSRVGMMNISDIRIEGGRKPMEHLDSKKRQRFLERQQKIEEARFNRYKEPESETPNTSNDASRTQPGSSIEMDHLGGQAPTLGAALVRPR